MMYYDAYIYAGCMVVGISLITVALFILFAMAMECVGESLSVGVGRRNDAGDRDGASSARDIGTNGRRVA